MFSLASTSLNSVTRQLLRCSYATSRLSPLDSIHRRDGGKMGDFCGWSLPFSFPTLSTIDSHKHTREQASLFDVSHMLRVDITGKHAYEFLESLFVADLSTVSDGSACYTLLLNDKGGILDDAILTKDTKETFYLVLNAACAEKDLNFLHAKSKEFNSNGKNVDIKERDGALVALQGPKAEEVLVSLVDDEKTVLEMGFLDSKPAVSIGGVPCRVTRCGYTGEDGFEIEIKGQSNIDTIVDLMLHNSMVQPAGLVARDTLRLEAGLALYGNDLNEVNSPIESSLNWTISKRRRKEGGFSGVETIQKHLSEGIKEKRVGLVAPSGGRLLRQGMEILKDEKVIGKICSGGFSPCLNHPIGMAFVPKEFSKIGTELVVKAGKGIIPITVSKMPFVPTNYKK